MSRGFVREDDQEEPVFIPARAPLPNGAENLVTPRGLALLREERGELEQARAAVEKPDGPGRRRELAEINGRVALVDQRIASAKVVQPGRGPAGEVRFGTTVSFRFTSGPQRGRELTYTIVGVDEARVADGLIAFTAPIAKAMLGKAKGETIAFRMGGETRSLQILAVGY